MTLLSNIFKKPHNTAAEIADARREIERRRKEVEARLNQIVPNVGFSGDPGPVRRAALETGTPGDLVALDREIEELRAELAQLDHQAAALNERHQRVKDEAAAAGLRPALKRLPTALAAVQAAERQLQAAKMELKETVSAVHQGRRAAGEDAPGVSDADLVIKIADAIGLYKTDQLGRYSLPRAELFDRLGCKRPPAFDPNADPRSQEKQTRDFSRDDQVDVRRQPEQSIWTKKEPGQAA